MATEKLFGNKTKPACEYCTEAYDNMGDGRVLCFKNGIVPHNHACKKYVYDPLKRIPPRPVPLIKFEEADFSI